MTTDNNSISIRRTPIIFSGENIDSYMSRLNKFAKSADMLAGDDLTLVLRYIKLFREINLGSITLSCQLLDREFKRECQERLESAYGISSPTQCVIDWIKGMNERCGEITSGYKFMYQLPPSKEIFRREIGIINTNDHFRDSNTVWGSERPIDEIPPAHVILSFMAIGGSFYISGSECVHKYTRRPWRKVKSKQSIKRQSSEYK